MSVPNQPTSRPNQRTTGQRTSARPTPGHQPAGQPITRVEITSLASTSEQTRRPTLARRIKKPIQVAAIVALVVAAGAGGAAYYYRYGDRSTSDFRAITEKTKEIVRVQVPDRMWPRIMVTRPDVMTMVLYATKDDGACVAILSCTPEWTRDRGHRPNLLLQSALQQYAPQFDTERWTGVTERDVPIRGAPERVKDGASYRTDDHKEVRVVSVDHIQSEKGTIAIFYQSLIHSSTDDEVERLLNSLK